MSYNGWTNYETWATALWIDNEEWSYHHARCLLDDYGKEGIEDGSTAAAFKDWIEEMMPNLKASLYSDLLGAAMSEINYQEIVKSYAVDFDWGEEEDVPDELDIPCDDIRTHGPGYYPN